MLAGRGISDFTKESTKEFTDWSFVKEDELKLASVPIDFLGINYYTPNRIEPAEDAQEFIVGQQPEVYPGTGNVRFVSREPKSLMGWEVRAESLTNTIRATAKALPGVPLMVTENGGAFPDEFDGENVHDPERTDYYFGHISACADAIEEGIDLRGKRFGLFYVDHKTQIRTPKDSAKFVKELLANR
jgi:beta-glucosidase